MVTQKVASLCNIGIYQIQIDIDGMKSPKASCDG